MPILKKKKSPPQSQDPVLSPGLNKDKLDAIAASIPADQPASGPEQPVTAAPEDPNAGLDAIKEILPAGWAHKIGCGILRGILLKMGKEQLTFDEAQGLENDHNKFEVWILAKLPAWLQKIAAENGPGINLLAAYSMLIIFKPSVLPAKAVDLSVNPVPVKPEVVKPETPSDPAAPTPAAVSTAVPGGAS